MNNISLTILDVVGQPKRLAAAWITGVFPPERAADFRTATVYRIEKIENLLQAP